MVKSMGLRLPLLPLVRVKILAAILSAATPLMRTIATPPSPSGVAIAAIVSCSYIATRHHLNNFENQDNPTPFD